MSMWSLRLHHLLIWEEPIIIFEFRQFSEYEVTPGIGFRGIVRPNLVGRVDWAYSKEGGAVFAGLNYPF